MEHARRARRVRHRTVSGVIGCNSDPLSTRAGGQDDVSLNKLPQINRPNSSSIRLNTYCLTDLTPDLSGPASSVFLARYFLGANAHQMSCAPLVIRPPAALLAHNLCVLLRPVLLWHPASGVFFCLTITFCLISVLRSFGIRPLACFSGSTIICV